MPKYDQIYEEASELLANAAEQSPSFARPVASIIAPVLVKMQIRPSVNDLADFVIPFLQAEFLKNSTEITDS